MIKERGREGRKGERKEGIKGGEREELERERESNLS